MLGGRGSYQIDRARTKLPSRIMALLGLIIKNKFGYAAPKSSVKANNFGMNVNFFLLLFSLIFRNLPVTCL